MAPSFLFVWFNGPSCHNIDTSGFSTFKEFEGALEKDALEAVSDFLAWAECRTSSTLQSFGYKWIVSKDGQDLTESSYASLKDGQVVQLDIFEKDPLNSVWLTAPQVQQQQKQRCQHCAH